MKKKKCNHILGININNICLGLFFRRTSIDVFKYKKLFSSKADYKCKYCLECGEKLRNKR